ncbi:mitochondrial cardiolipin hydrolase [Chironomus tepperi]|uniref:mitochondrial cardiolipin hydrolase n=1 Tax=Chironomus tepperi TaxID=113505 RepID=UPI00391FC85C
MVLSKLLKYFGIGVGVIICGEIYCESVKVLRDRFRIQDEMEEVNEVFRTRNPIDDNKSILVRQIKFCREPTLYITEILENLLLSARKTIHVAMYIFTSKILADALKSVYEKGVKIYVIVDHTMEAASGTQTQNLKEKGIAVKICYSNTLHHKFCLIDVPYNNNIFATEGSSAIDEMNCDKPCQVNIPKNGILINGSLNWTREALTSNYENFIVTSNRNVINEYYDEFVERWKDSENL